MFSCLTDKNVFGGYFGFQKELYRAVKSNQEYSVYTMYYETLKQVRSD